MYMWLLPVGVLIGAFGNHWGRRGFVPTPMLYWYIPTNA